MNKNISKEGVDTRTVININDVVASVAKNYHLQPIDEYDVFSLIRRNTDISIVALKQYFGGINYVGEDLIGEEGLLKLLDFSEEITNGSEAIIFPKKGFKAIKNKDQIRKVDDLPVYNPNHTYAVKDEMFLENIGGGVKGVVQEITGRHDNIMNVQTPLGIKKLPMKRNFHYVAHNVKQMNFLNSYSSNKAKNKPL